MTAMRRLSHLLAAVFYATLAALIIILARQTISELMRAWIAAAGLFLALVNIVMYGNGAGHARREDGHEYQSSTKKARMK